MEETRRIYERDKYISVLVISNVFHLKWKERMRIKKKTRMVERHSTIRKNAVRFFLDKNTFLLGGIFIRLSVHMMSCEITHIFFQLSKMKNCKWSEVSEKSSFFLYDNLIIWKISLSLICLFYKGRRNMKNFRSLCFFILTYEKRNAMAY